MYVYFVAIVLDLVDNRTVVQSSLQRDALRYRRNVPKGNASGTFLLYRRVSPVMRNVKTRYGAIKGVKLATWLERIYVQWLRQKMI